ncbi:hypothetical protein OGAPHI_007447 [Ogataea philodendri]|uniref:Uncharacterized protein n=1 Tax=Ogataea philodendri TaxID=1378263 RepID=A0A9P8NV64_9ASCO|nr:uncharacterized protein OGAPHI_007447 [Ogataea philodendri]KAH3660242.1 hypothetical protein OGAPHI_007447 [Ogataea philodendri]
MVLPSKTRASVLTALGLYRISPPWMSFMIEAVAIKISSDNEHNSLIANRDNNNLHRFAWIGLALNACKHSWYSKGRCFELVFRNGYKNSGIWAFKKGVRVSGCEATHCNNARALQTLLEAGVVRFGGDSIGYTATISSNKLVMTPNEFHKTRAKSSLINELPWLALRASNHDVHSGTVILVILITKPNISHWHKVETGIDWQILDGTAFQIRYAIGWVDMIGEHIIHERANITLTTGLWGRSKIHKSPCVFSVRINGHDVFKVLVQHFEHRAKDSLTALSACHPCQSSKSGSDKRQVVVQLSRIWVGENGNRLEAVRFFVIVTFNADNESFENVGVDVSLVHEQVTLFL